MSTMRDADRDRGKMHGALADLLERAASSDPDEALTNESALSLEVSGKYVNVLFSTGGPHVELTAEYWDAGAAEYWFENEPAGAWFTYKDWGTREDVYIAPREAESIMQAITRDPETPGEGES